MSEQKSSKEQFNCPTHGQGACVCLGARYWMDRAIRAERAADEQPAARDERDESGRNGVFRNCGYVGTASGHIVRDGTFWVATFRNNEEAEQYVELRMEQRHTLDCDLVKHPNCTHCSCRARTAEPPADVFSKVQSWMRDWQNLLTERAHRELESIVGTASSTKEAPARKDLQHPDAGPRGDRYPLGDPQ